MAGMLGNPAAVETGGVTAGSGQGDFYALNPSASQTGTLTSGLSQTATTDGTTEIFHWKNAGGTAEFGLYGTVFDYTTIHAQVGTSNSYVLAWGTAKNWQALPLGSITGALIGATKGTPLELTALGAGAAGITSVGGATTVTGTGNSFIGWDSGNATTSGTWNTALGAWSLYTNILGTDNVAVGWQALKMYTGSQSTAVGSNALASATAGPNDAFGYNALNVNTSTFNVAVGYSAMGSATGGSNTAIGYQAMNTSTSGSNVAAGYQALLNVTGGSNVAVGYGTMAAVTSSAASSVAVGYQALNAVSTGSNNQAFGYQALALTTTGGGNVALGWQAGQANTTGSNQLFISGFAGSSGTKCLIYGVFGGNSATSLTFNDDANTWFTMDTRTGNSGSSAFTFKPGTAPSFASAAGSSYNSVSLSAYQLTLTGGVAVTALNGLQQSILQPTVTSTSATTVTTASTHYIAGNPIAGGSVTITNGYAQYIDNNGNSIWATAAATAGTTTVNSGTLTLQAASWNTTSLSSTTETVTLQLAAGASGATPANPTVVWNIPVTGLGTATIYQWKFTGTEVFSINTGGNAYLSAAFSMQHGTAYAASQTLFTSFTTNLVALGTDSAKRLQLDGNGSFGGVTTKNNTLDDGSGNVTAIGSVATHTLFEALSATTGTVKSAAVLTVGSALSQIITLDASGNTLLSTQTGTALLLNSAASGSVNFQIGGTTYVAINSTGNFEVAASTTYAASTNLLLGFSAGLVMLSTDANKFLALDPNGSFGGLSNTIFGGVAATSGVTTQNSNYVQWSSFYWNGSASTLGGIRAYSTPLNTTPEVAWRLATDIGGTVLDQLEFGFLNNNVYVTVKQGGSFTIEQGVGLVSTVTLYKNISTAGWGVPAIYGADLRTGSTTADGSPVTQYAVTASGGVFEIGGSFTVTAYTSGTVTYTITWTDENAATHTLTGSLTATGHVDFTPVTVRVKASTNITAQVTGVFVATVSPVAAVKQVG